MAAPVAGSAAPAAAVLGQPGEAPARPPPPTPAPASTPRHRRTQLWGAALPLNSPGVECIFDPSSRVGVCGDWLMGSSMQAAAVSGIALAQRIVAARDAPVQEHAGLAIGLDRDFGQLRAVEAIGQFPAARRAAVPA
jgi:hypothetical protein